MSLALPDLPYKADALAPYISARTLEFHHGKHHAAYVANAGKLIAATALENAPLEEIIKAAAADSAKKGLFNNAAQIWNHTFYWNSLKPGGGGTPTGALAAAIDRDFGSFDAFAKDFAAKAVAQFGSGWAWLVENAGKLEIVTTANADTPLVHGAKALLTVDVWEHAYYLDYQNRRPDYVKIFLDHLANWDFAAANLEK
jgi:superoxide dismutase, Fe-Mn family